MLKNIQHHPYSKCRINHQFLSQACKVFLKLIPNSLCRIISHHSLQESCIADKHSLCVSISGLCSYSLCLDRPSVHLCLLNHTSSPKPISNAAPPGNLFRIISPTSTSPQHFVHSWCGISYTLPYGNQSHNYLLLAKTRRTWRRDWILFRAVLLRGPSKTAILVELS